MSGNHRLRFVLWDWNGTLLDDLDLCLRALNILCRRRGIPEVSLEEYRARFTFPVVDYYKSVGFDPSPESFAEAAREWVDIYVNNVWTETALYDRVETVLAEVRDSGMDQAVLSAHQHDMLLRAVEHFGLSGFFGSIRGLKDYNAESKVELGREWLRESGVEPGSILMVGDTLHDREVAGELGVRCVLVAQGHQARDRLLAAGVPVLNTIAEVPALLRELGIGTDAP